MTALCRPAKFSQVFINFGGKKTLGKYCVSIFFGLIGSSSMLEIPVAKDLHQSKRVSSTVFYVYKSNWVIIYLCFSIAYCIYFNT